MKFQYKVIFSFLLGMIAGKVINIIAIADETIQILLFILMFMIGFEGGYNVTSKEIGSGIKKGLKTLFVAILGSAIAGIIFIPFMGKLSLISSLGLGWYTFTGSYLATQIGGNAGFIGFVVNLSRELFGMIAIPSLSRKLPCYALISLAGSPASDTLFPFIYRECGDISIVPSIFQGLMTLFTVPLLISLVIGL
ncbi:MAG: lysine exporter LysO family protein [Fervidicoccaceae archaeon]|jgi:uncharacterized membrane protein YbjE (DUF340 family)|nr:MAG: hypothetical protein C0177_02120 [Fervidicoccus fontis]